MPLEKGGRADKKGNQYEINCIIIEALGVDEVGTDILVTTFEGINFYKDFCTEMGLNFEKDTDILKSIILNAIFQNLTMISDILDCPKRISMI